MALDTGVLPTALTNTVARTDFNNAMAQLDAAFPLAKENLAGDAVVTVKIKDVNVTTEKIALLAVTAAQLGPQAVETAKVKLLNITSALLGPQAVETSKIKLLNVTEATLAGLAVSAAKLQTDSVETLKIKALNVTKGKAELGFGRYVPLDKTGQDFAIGDFTLDGTWKVDGLNVSGIVPAGAIAVAISGSIQDNAVSSIFVIRGNATTKVGNVCQWTTQVANVYTPFIAMIFNIDSNRLLDYLGTAGMIAVDITVQGYII